MLQNTNISIVGKRMEKGMKKREQRKQRSIMCSPSERLLEWLSNILLTSHGLQLVLPNTKLQESLRNSVFIRGSHLSSQTLIGHLLWEKEIMNVVECGRLCNYSHKCSVPRLPLIYQIWPHDSLPARTLKPELYELTSRLPYPLPSAMGLAVFWSDAIPSLGPGGEKTWSRAAAGLWATWVKYKPEIWGSFYCSMTYPSGFK